MHAARRGTNALAAALLFLPALAQPMLPAALRKPPPTKCEWSAPESVPEGEPAGTRTLSIGPATATQIWMVRSGNRISLAASGVEAGDKVSVRISAKIADSNSEFSLVCKLTPVRAGSTKPILVAHAPLGSLDVIWRVEVRLSRAVSQPRPAPSLLARNISTVRGDQLPREIPLDGMVCLGDIPEMRLTRPASHRFGGKTRLEVNAEQTTYKLTTVEQAILVDSILRSVSLWVRACIACKVEHLAVVTVDGRMYTRPAVLKWLDSVSKSRPAGREAWSPTSEQDAALAHELQPVQMLMAGEPPEKPPTAKVLDRYSELPGTSKDLLCSLRTSKEASPVADAVRRAACGGGVDRLQAARIRIRFRDGPTACGDDRNVIACRSDTELTEYNARDYRFVVQTGGDDSIGAGPTDVALDHVIAHEMGHWIGLDHIESSQSLMASSMEDSRCIDMATVSQLVAQPAAPAGLERPQPFTMKRLRRGHR